MKENRTHVKLACDGVLLIGGSKNNRTRHWFLTQNRKWIMRRQPWIPIKRQPFYLFKNWKLHHHHFQATTQQNSKSTTASKKGETFEVGLMGWMRVHLGRTFPLATHVSQCKPESQFLSATHVCPSCWRLWSWETSLSKLEAKRVIEKD